MNPKRYTNELLEFIKAHAYGRETKELTDLVNITFKTNFKASYISSLRYRHGFKSFTTNHGKRRSINTEFKKGQVPFNKGLKGIHYSPDTEFKEGHTPVNTQPVGTIKLRDDGYLWIKLAETKPSRFGWKQLHRYSYEIRHGSIPLGKKIVFLDGNRMNCDIENLQIVSPGELATLNKFKLIKQNPELTKIGINIVKLISKASDIRRKDGGRP